jgi:hypothetical protein
MSAMKKLILALATFLPAASASTQTLEQAGLRLASIGPVWPHPTSSDALRCMGAPPRDSFLGAEALISVAQGRVEARIRDTFGLSPDFKALASKLGLDGKHEVWASFEPRDCHVSPSGRWTCYGKARVELVGLVVRGETAWFEADALLVADQDGANLVTKHGGAQVVQTARFGAGECR